MYRMFEKWVLENLNIFLADDDNNVISSIIMLFVGDENVSTPFEKGEYTCFYKSNPLS